MGETKDILATLFLLLLPYAAPRFSAGADDTPPAANTTRPKCSTAATELQTPLVNL